MTTVINIVIGALTFIVLGAFGIYVQQKVKNLATRQDVAKITGQIEGVKLQYSTILLRRSRVYERQVEILGKLYKHLTDVKDYAQLMTQQVRLEGEKQEEYPMRFREAWREARDEFVSGRLFLSGNVVDQVDDFFLKTNEMFIELDVASDLPPGMERADSWKKAAQIAHTKLPDLLKKIEDQAREIIGSEERLVHAVFDTPKSQPPGQ